MEHIISSPMSDGITDAYRQHKIAEREDAMYKASIEMICHPNKDNLQRLIECCDEFAKVPPSHGINPAKLAQSEKEFFQSRYGDDNFDISEDDITGFLERFQPQYRTKIREEINRKLF